MQCAVVFFSCCFLTQMNNWHSTQVLWQLSGRAMMHQSSYQYPIAASKVVHQVFIHHYSPCNRPVWIVHKKQTDTGKKRLRMIIDFKKLNEKFISDKYTIPDTSATLKPGKFFILYHNRIEIWVSSVFLSKLIGGKPPFPWTTESTNFVDYHLE